MVLLVLERSRYLHLRLLVAAGCSVWHSKAGDEESLIGASQPPRETPAFNPYAGHADLEKYTNLPGSSSTRKHNSASRQALEAKLSLGDPKTPGTAFSGNFFASKTNVNSAS